MRTPLICTLLLAAVLTACSDTNNSEGVAPLETTQAAVAGEGAPDESPEIEAELAMLDFTQCLRDRGVDVGDPTMGADGNLQLPPIEFAGSAEQDPETAIAEMEASFAECEEHLAGVTLGAPDPGAGVALQDALVQYAGCMRDHGIDMPDPDFSAGGGIIDLGSPTPGDEAEFESAHGECRDILAGAGMDF